MSVKVRVFPLLIDSTLLPKFLCLLLNYFSNGDISLNNITFVGESWSSDILVLVARMQGCGYAQGNDKGTLLHFIFPTHFNVPVNGCRPVGRLRKLMANYCPALSQRNIVIAATAAACAGLVYCTRCAGLC